MRLKSWGMCRLALAFDDSASGVGDALAKSGIELADGSREPSAEALYRPSGFTMRPPRNDFALWLSLVHVFC